VGAKAYEQAAGFVRIKEGLNILDNTGVHPESYEIAKKLQKIEPDQRDLQLLASEWNVGVQTLRDIQKELEKPGFDPRSELPIIPFKEGITDINSLEIGSLLSGIVRNITDFGAFVDIGLKNDGMIHISKMSPSRISHPLEVLSLNQYLPKMEVLSVDKEKQKVGLGLVY
jgi:protein Tex